MAISVVMPALEMAQDTGKLVSWRKKEGEAVAKGEILLEVETDKAVVEVEAQAAGMLGGVKAQPGDVIPVGHTIAWLLGPGEAFPRATLPRKRLRMPRDRRPRLLPQRKRTKAATARDAGGWTPGAHFSESAPARQGAQHRHRHAAWLGRRTAKFSPPTSWPR